VKALADDLAAARVAHAWPATSARARTGLATGDAFALDAPAVIESVWGDGENVLWPEGEPVLLYGPDGVGKGTTTHQLILRRIGIGGTRFLGLTVKPTSSRVLYLAMDRPQQAARSLSRMVTNAHRDALRKHLVVWQGTVPFDVVRHPESLAAFTRDRGADTLVIDALKDLAPKLSDEETGMAIHRAWQFCNEAGIEVLTNHHPRKATAENKKPRTLADVYGSRWITAGCGSVILLWGDAGDPIVELEHLKQPSEIVGPLTLQHDGYQGVTTVLDAADVVQVVANHVGPPPDASDVAKVLFRVAKPSRSQVEKARRRLEAAAREKRLERLPADAGEPVGYRLAAGVTAGGHGGSRQGVTGDGHGAPYVVGAGDPRSRKGSTSVTVPDPDIELERVRAKFGTDLEASG
jgi:hypothetical protein